MALTKEAANLLQRFGKLVSQRDETKATLVVARQESNSAAIALEATRNDQTGGGMSSASSREKVRRASEQFGQAEERVAKLDTKLAEVNAEIVSLEPAATNAWNSFTQELSAESDRDYEQAALNLINVVRRRVAYRLLGMQIPFPIEDSLMVPVLNTTPVRQVAPLIPKVWTPGTGQPYTELPTWDEVAQQRLDEAMPLLNAVKIITAEGKVAREEERQLLITSKTVERSNRERGIGQGVPIAS